MATEFDTDWADAASDLLAERGEDGTHVDESGTQTSVSIAVVVQVGALDNTDRAIVYAKEEDIPSAVARQHYFLREGGTTRLTVVDVKVRHGWVRSLCLSRIERT
jgi:hypothetical protein